MFRLSLIVLLIFSAFPACSAAEEWLWEIGKLDQQYAELALSKEGYLSYQADPLFVVGESDASKDWPYVHPGPQDEWAGREPHTYSVVFGLSRAGGEGNARLSVAVVDTSAQRAPRLAIRVNGTTFVKSLRRGTGEASLNGDPSKGRSARIHFDFPARLLRQGANLIEMTTESGGWLAYDWVGLRAPGGLELTRAESFTDVRAHGIRGLIERDGKFYQPIELTVRHVGAPALASIRFNDQELGKQEIQPGIQIFTMLSPAVDQATSGRVVLQLGDRNFDAPVTLSPVRKLTLFIFAHSHHDLGYTDLQPETERKQIDNLKKAIRLAQKTAGYPEGARFIWNVESLWGVDQYFRQCSDADKELLVDAIHRGWVNLTGAYGNELTGLCRPEELLRVYEPSLRLADELGVKIENAMLCDVPGVTWGTVTAMSHAGIRYFTSAPNFHSRVGTYRDQWQSRPFWWIAPSGQRVLFWMPENGYAMPHAIPTLNEAWVGQYQGWLDEKDYPYDMAAVCCSNYGDNDEPYPRLPGFVKGWNERYAWPKLKIASVREAFEALEARYGKELPEFKGDLTPYWEDGAGSSAAETALNRNASDRLVQAEALFAMLAPDQLPLAEVREAWRNVLLYSEHTWGDNLSISRPDADNVKAQWAIKQAFAVNADQQSRQLVDRALDRDGAAVADSTIDIFNTTSWTRSGLVLISPAHSQNGDRVSDASGKGVVSQRLKTGELAVLARDVPPFAAVRYRIEVGEPHAVETPAKIEDVFISNGRISARVDRATGGICELKTSSDDTNYARTTPGEQLNDYTYFIEKKLSDLQRPSETTISIQENGPLVASLRVESKAAGCNTLTREIRLVAGADHLELINTIDKTRPRASARGIYQKESVSFSFPFNVENGQVRLDIPWGMMRPEIDQLPGSCKDWLIAGRWADVSNDQKGVTLATLDAPLVQVGAMTTLLEGFPELADWRKKIEPTQTIYSWVMNNWWYTNYRAYQEGIVVFRYAVRPHGAFDAADSARFATGLTQPLIVSAARGPAPSDTPLLSVEPADVLVTALKPSNDGKAWIVRLFGASGEAREAKLNWSTPPASLSLSDLTEKAINPLGDPISVPGFGVVTIRAERR